MLEPLGEWLKYLLHTQSMNNITSFSFLFQSEQTLSLTLSIRSSVPVPPDRVFFYGWGRSPDVFRFQKSLWRFKYRLSSFTTNCFRSLTGQLSRISHSSLNWSSAISSSGAIPWLRQCSIVSFARFSSCCFWLCFGGRFFV